MYRNLPNGGGQLSVGPGGVSCQSSGLVSMERVRYFARQLITPDDLTQEQEYFRAKLRRHNRLLHGWGVVCGLEVKPAATEWSVTIEPGYALGPQGDEILVEQQVTVDLSRQDLEGNALLSCGEIDPCCSNVRVGRAAGEQLFIAVAYAECTARPVRGQPAGCGCDGGDCEYSRIRDGYSGRVLSASQLPASCRRVAAQPPFL